MSIDVQGKVVLVTGGSRGIGEAMATALARGGAKVAVASRKREGIDTAAERIREAVPNAEIAAFVAHMGDPAAVTALMDETESALGPIDAVINNAATNPYFGPMLAIDDGAYDKTFAVNTRGYFELARHAAKRMIDGKRPGSIINVASVAALRGAPLQGVYAMTKAAVVSMTQTLAVELAVSGIRVNAIAPGYIETKLSSAIVQNEELNQRATSRIPLGRVGQPDDIGGTAVFLVSDASSYMTGHTMVVDGGMTIAVL